MKVEGLGIKVGELGLGLGGEGIENWASGFFLSGSGDLDFSFYGFVFFWFGVWGFRFAEFGSYKYLLYAVVRVSSNVPASRAHRKSARPKDA